MFSASVCFLGVLMYTVVLLCLGGGLGAKRGAGRWRSPFALQRQGEGRGRPSGASSITRTVGGPVGGPVGAPVGGAPTGGGAGGGPSEFQQGGLGAACLRAPPCRIRTPSWPKRVSTPRALEGTFGNIWEHLGTFGNIWEPSGAVRGLSCRIRLGLGPKRVSTGRPGGGLLAGPTV